MLVKYVNDIYNDIYDEWLYVNGMYITCKAKESD